VATNFNVEKIHKTKLNVNVNQQTLFSCDNCSWMSKIYTAQKHFLWSLFSANLPQLRREDKRNWQISLLSKISRWTGNFEFRERSV